MPDGLLGVTENVIGRVLFRVGWWLYPECDMDGCDGKRAAHDLCVTHAIELREVAQELVEQ